MILALGILFLSAASASALDSVERTVIWTKTWTAVRDHFVPFDASARLEWESQFDEALRQLIGAPTDVEFWRGLRLRIAALEDGQTTVDFPDNLPQEYDTVPLRMLVAGEKLLVWRLSSSPDIQASGIHVGDELLSVEGIAVKEWVEREALPHVSGSTFQGRWVRAVDRIFSGKTGTPVELHFRRLDGSEYSVMLTRDSGTQNTYYRERFDSVVFSSRLLNDKYLYVNFGRSLSVSSAEGAERLLDENLNAEAVIFDLRETSAGVLPRALISRLACFPLPLGPYQEVVWESVQDTSSNEIVYQPRKIEVAEEMVQPQSPLFRGSVIVLVGAATSGAAEQFLQPLVFARRTVLVGETTAGAGGLTDVLRFDDGASVAITVREPKWENGYGNHCGFPPDIPVVPTAQGMAQDRDEVLGTALEYLRR